MSMDLSWLGTMVLFVNLSAVELSVWMGFLHWGQFISMRVYSIGTNTLAVMKIHQVLTLLRRT